jgi:hypothetical protein
MGSSTISAAGCTKSDGLTFITASQLASALIDAVAMPGGIEHFLRDGVMKEAAGKDGDIHHIARSFFGFFRLFPFGR